MSDRPEPALDGQRDADASVTEVDAMVDAEARRRIAEELGTTFLVEAAAGTGKTTALVGRMLAAVEAGAHLDRMVALTFTDKAAGELKLRLREGLERRRASTNEPTLRARFDAGLAALELAHVGTIHGFCAELLRERPVEAQVDPAFEMLAEEEGDRLLARAFDAWFAGVLANPPDGVRRVLQARRWSDAGQDDAGPRRDLLRACRDLVERRDFAAPWTLPSFPRRERLLEALDAIEAFGEACVASPTRHKDPDWATKFGLEVRTRARDLRAMLARSSEADGLDALESALRALTSTSLRKKWGYQLTPWKWKGAEDARLEADRTRGIAVALLDEVLRECDEELAARLQLELQDVVARYEDLKRRRGVLDFLDLLALARDLVRDHAGARAELQARFTHLFVDELQDTDPLQSELLLLLAADDPNEKDWRSVRVVPGKLFVVGDPKQAIYRFRRADLAVYEDVKTRVIEAGGEVLTLRTSFRARPSIQRFVNAAFATTFGEGTPGVQARDVPLAPARPDVTDRPSVIVLPVPDPYGDWSIEPTDRAVQASYPDAVAAFVAWLLRESGWTIDDERGDEPRKLAAKDVCLLFSRMSTGWSDLAEDYVRALEARQVSHVVHGGRSFFDREEILALRQVLAAIEHPDDALAVFAVLRGAFFGFSDPELFAYRETVGPLSPFARPSLVREPRGSSAGPTTASTTSASSSASAAASTTSPATSAGKSGVSHASSVANVGTTSPTKPATNDAIADALALLRALHDTRNERPFADTLSRFLDATRAHAGLAFWPSPRQTLASVARFVDRARRFDARGATSFRAFADWVEDEAARAGGGDAPYVEEGADGVRLMTVHRAKGLEFPVVIVVDPSAKAENARPSRYVDSTRGLWAVPLCGAVPRELNEHAPEVKRADVAERARLLYVATTRARELLVVPGLGDGRALKWWTSPLNDVVYPERGAEPEPVVGVTLSFGNDSVRVRNEKVIAAREKAGAPFSPVRPGRHRRGELDVTWWDPNALPLDVEPLSGLRHRKLLDPKGKGHAQAVAAHARWSKARASLVERASVPTFPVRTVREVALEGVKEGREVVTVTTGSWHEGRPTGPRFGTLVHAILAEIPFDATEGATRALARAHGRLLGATPNEIDAAAGAVSAALAHPLLQRAASATRVCRETALHRKLPDGTLVEGVVDLAFLEDDPFGDVRWTVVDYKTDLSGGAPDDYVVQVELYAKAIEAATGQPADAVLLGV
jgi:ATP-dependent exoDNAse (exonuclease V) beta subunit